MLPVRPGLALFVAGLFAASADTTYIVELVRPPVAEATLSREISPASVGVPGLPSGPVRRAEVLADQAALEPAIRQLGGRITGRFQTVLNAFRVDLPVSAEASVRALPGVKQVRVAHQYRRQLTHSVPWVGAPAVWSSSGPGLTGKNVRIGIVDSGIDYTHADFGGSGLVADYKKIDPTVIQPGTFPTAKVVGGTDFVGENYDASGQYGSTTPVPDPNPLDNSSDFHGTHVAGIAAGLGVTTNRVTYTGGYSDSYATNEFSIGPGVAPEASLYALKIFGKQGKTSAVPDALDWAADPNQDGLTTDRLDVVNLSLGSRFGAEDGTDPEQEAVDRLSRLGCLVCISAGNDGNTPFIVSAPGVAVRAITVANSLANGNSTTALRITAPSSVAGLYGDVEGDFTARLAATGPVLGKVVATDPADACSTIQNGAAIQGNIALINRGTCHFTDKIRNAQTNGAIGVIMVNNVSGPPIVMGKAATDDTSDIKIPGVMITQADGATLRAQLSQGLYATLASDVILSHPEYADQLDDSSARGPSLATSRLKPDLAAPGSGIHSAYGGTGADGITYTGTSMSAPHVSGAAALLKQAHPDWSVEDIKAALMNTSVPTHDSAGHLYPESRTGAGRLKVDAAVATSVIAKADDAEGDVSLSFGRHELTAAYSVTRSVRLDNHGTAPVTLTISASNTYSEPGIVFTPDSPTVTIPPGGNVSVGLKLNVDPAQFVRAPEPTSAVLLGKIPRVQLPESSGQIWFTNSTLALHLPWYGVFRAASDYHATVTTVGTPATDGAMLRLPTRGGSAHSAPLVSIFEVGSLIPSHGFTDEQSQTDVVAVGAASDYFTVGSLDNTSVYFGLAVAGTWPTPQRAWINLDVEIDVNNDGLPDYTLVNGDAGTLASGNVDTYSAANGALETVVRDESLTQENLTVGSVINLLPADFRDTAPFANGTYVHGTLVTNIGLGAGLTSFRYRVNAQGSYDTKTPWVTFDVARPVIDPTAAGIRHTPYFDEGLTPEVVVRRSLAAANGYSPSHFPQALILHQHGIAGDRLDVVSLDITTDDSDHDGLPDAWELAYFGDLSQSGTDDTNGDGLTNAQKYQMGLDPLIPRLQVGEVPLDPIRWTSWPGYFYSLQQSVDLSKGFTDLRTHIPATGTTTSVTLLSDVVLPTVFYRVRRE